MILHNRERENQNEGWQKRKDDSARYEHILDAEQQWLYANSRPAVVDRRLYRFDCLFFRKIHPRNRFRAFPLSLFLSPLSLLLVGKLAWHEIVRVNVTYEMCIARYTGTGQDAARLGLLPNRRADQILDVNVD